VNDILRHVTNTLALKTVMNLQRMGRHPPPQVAIFDLTRRCDNQCAHCLNTPFDEAALDVWMERIQEVQNIGVATVVLTGGEPLLSPHFWPVLEELHGKGLESVITTNGTSITEENVERLERLGVKMVHLSIDGPRGVHDSIRGEGAYDRARSALGLLQPSKMAVTIGTCVTKPLMPHLMDYVHEWLGEDIAGLFLIRTVSPGTGEMELPDVREVRKALKGVKSKKLYLSCGLEDRCPAGKLAFTVSPDGSLRGCADIERMPETIVGLEDAWKNGFEPFRRGIRCLLDD